MPGLALEDRKRLAEVLAGSISIPQAAAAYGCSREKLIALATREGFQSLLKDLRHPLLIAMQDAARREELLAMIREASPVSDIAVRFGCSRSAVWGYFYRTGLDHPYREARRKRSRQSYGPPDMNPALTEKLCIAAMLASRGLTVGAVPTLRGSQILDINLRVGDQHVRILRTRSAVVERNYYRVHPTIPDAWYCVVTDRRHLIVFAPPHDGRIRYIPIWNPVLMLDSKEPPWGLWKMTEWPTPQELGIHPKRQPKRPRQKKIAHAG